MLTIFSPKIILKDLIPDNHIDIHSHILPGIDDGAQTIEDTIKLTNKLQEFGFEQFITTPHIMSTVWKNTKYGIENKLERTLKELNQNSIEIPIKAAAEYLIDAQFVSLFSNEPLLVLKDNYVLVELNYINPLLQLYDILFDLQVAGYKPVLAHPERYSYYHNNSQEYQKLKNAGCLFQLNLLSTVGYYGTEVTKTAEKLLRDGMIDFVGSDVHHQNHLDAFSKKTLIKDVNPLKIAIKQNQFFRF
jgi:tyrosine-protein phosphatase YwqE